MLCNNSDILDQKVTMTRREAANLKALAKIAIEAAKRGYYVEALPDLADLACNTNFLLGCGPRGEDDFDAKAFLSWVEGESDRFGHLVQRAPDAPPPEPKVKILTPEQIDRLSPIQRLNYANRLAEVKETTLRDNHKESARRLADINSAYPK